MQFTSFYIKKKKLTKVIKLIVNFHKDLTISL